MKAMIFAAGKGTRLHPLTKDKPKALVDIHGVTMLENAIRYLVSYGFDEIIINVHHFAEQVVSFLEENNYFNAQIEISDERDVLLDTGGGLKKASWFFEDQRPFLVYNVDILTNLNLNNLLEYHKQCNGLATLAVRNRESSRYLLFDDNYRLVGREHAKNNQRILHKEAGQTIKRAFSGIHVLEPSIFNYLPDTDIFPIIDSYMEIAKEQPIYGFSEDQSYWFDIGDPEKLKKARDFMASR
jgi:NDP-sugar pyrophosphorylase family protein